MATILVVAYEGQTRKWIEGQLRGQGRTILTASCLEEAERAIRGEPVHLAIIIRQGLAGERLENFLEMCRQAKLPVIVEDCQKFDDFMALFRRVGGALPHQKPSHRPFGVVSALGRYPCQRESSPEHVRLGW